MNVEFDTSGLVVLSSSFADAASNAPLLVSRAIRKTATDIQGGAQRRAPVDTGFLRSSIGASVGIMSAEIGPTASYGHFVELGTSRMAPQPYLFPSLEAATPGFMAAMEAVGVEAIRL